MKTAAFAVALLGLFPAIMAAETLAPSPTESVGCEPHGDHWHCEAARTDAGDDAEEASETLAPSPTESVGCEPHGDHWHCEGPRSTLLTAQVTTTEAEDDHDDHEAGATESLAPSPTESVGCEPHGDHWHCEGPATGADAAATTSADDHDHDDEDHDHESGATESLAPSPTESVGCEPHGDHWHCEGPATAAGSADASTTEATTGTPTASDGAQVTNAAGIEMVPVLGMFAAAVLAL
ncbi:hypothetical protein FDECE_3107 [Fusarium decemcellulare]|nr:hypothetical protein FDECE_3107 [Fusarium decemcellulare]